MGCKLSKMFNLRSAYTIRLICSNGCSVLSWASRKFGLTSVSASTRYFVNHVFTIEDKCKVSIVFVELVLGLSYIVFCEKQNSLFPTLSKIHAVANGVK